MAWTVLCNLLFFDSENIEKNKRINESQSESGRECKNRERITVKSAVKEERQRNEIANNICNHKLLEREKTVMALWSE